MLINLISLILCVYAVIYIHIYCILVQQHNSSLCILLSVKERSINYIYSCIYSCSALPFKLIEQHALNCISLFLQNTQAPSTRFKPSYLPNNTLVRAFKLLCKPALIVLYLHSNYSEESELWFGLIESQTQLPKSF